MLLSWKGAGFCQMLFLYWNEHVVFVLCSINVVYYTNLFYHFRDILLVMVYNPLSMLLDLFCQYFVEDFKIYIHKGY